MGMYTALHLNVELKENFPKDVVEVLKYMTGEAEEMECGMSSFNHELFDADRWRYMLQMDSYYFRAQTNSKLRWDDISNAYYLDVVCNLKNYDGEIEKFLDWLYPYIDAGVDDFLGFYRYEESNVPTLIFYGLENLITICPDISFNKYGLIEV